MKKQDIIITLIFILAIIFSKGDFAFSFLFLIYLSTFIYRYFSKRSKDSPFFKHLKNLCKLGYTILLVAFIGFEAILLKDIAINKDNFPKSSHVIVLGGKLKDNIPSKTLELRLIRAYEYYEKFPDTIFILSGGKGDDENLPEAQGMANYLIEKGIPEKNLILEDKATSTYENFKFSKEILDSSEVENIGVISSSFHLYRAKFIAKKLDIPVEAIYAKSPLILFFNCSLREFFAYFNEIRK